MCKFLITSFLSFTILLSFGQSSLQSPEQFLGYELGDRFTRHHRVVEYFQQVAATRPNNVKIIQYGETYEHRPLIVAVVASDENFKKLDQIRMDNLRRTGFEQGAPSTNVALVWLSYNVHGNEANSTEASMKTLHAFADPSNARTQDWLKNTVVILDPCINPDGRDRYANFYNQYGNYPPNPSIDSKEHREPWPGGRANHYLFDLNRDWAWQTQTESQARIRLYNQWMPHVHVDFHEQFYNNPYYFAPAAEPLHEVISKWQREFETMIGKNNAKYFDEQGWLYFTKERFDLYYPSYGDTYPTYSGAIGMTYEQGGHGFGGLTVTTKEGDQLTLKDRLTHHFTNGLSTVEVTSKNAARVTEEFEKYFKENLASPAAPYKTYVIKATNPTDKINRLTSWMDTHRIQYGHPGVTKASRGFDFENQTTGNVSVSTDDIVINVYQPKGRFVTTLFEPQSKLNDSITYDITAWNLMYAYGLKAYALNERINVAKPYEKVQAKNAAINGKPYAYIFKYESLADVKFLAAMLKNGFKVRSADYGFAVAGESFDRGTLIVTRKNNEELENFDSSLQSLANEMSRRIYTTTTGYVDRGKDFGSADVNYLKAPNVALIG
ncbi:MAG: M14 family metallopeptidase, partial [Cyclobacteriaceae bacterium]